MLVLTAVLSASPHGHRRGVVGLRPNTMAALGLEVHAPVRLEGARTSGAVAVPDLVAAPGTVRCDDLLLSNLGVRDGAQVRVARADEVAATTVTVSGQRSVVDAVDPAVLRTALLGKVLTAGDAVSLLPQELTPLGPQFDAASARQRLKATLGPLWTTLLVHVRSVDPPGPALVTMGTVVGWEGGTTTTGSATPLVVPTTPADARELPGLEEQVAALREWLELGFGHRDLLERLGARPSMGVLVTGPAGSGKAAVVETVAAQVGARLVRLWAPQLAALDPAAAAAQLTTALQTSGPAVVLVEDVEALAPRDEPSPLLPTLLDAVRAAVAAGRVAVVCTTAHPERVSTALREPGTLDHELALPQPDRSHRLRFLEHATRSVPLDADVSLEDVAARTPGFVAADLLALVRGAGLRAAARQRDAEQPSVSRADLEAALEVVRPSTLSGERVDVGRLTLDDVGDMAEVKAALTETVLWPLQYPDTFDRLGVDPPRGVLLYGPPGCGKTFLVRALAGSGQANVHSVKGAELLSKWVGESERAVRELFRRARESSPSLVFLDEVDALAPTRGQSTDGGTTDRVVAALLTELDGVETLRDVVVVGATNRPDLIDPALLRPGRLERLVFVPPPDAEARSAILRAAATDVPLADDVDLDDLGRRTDGYSAADCAALVREAALTAMRESLQAATVTAAHVEQALGRVRPSLDPAQVAALQAYADRREG